MKTVCIIAPTGMLGNMVYNVLKDEYDLVLIYRDKEKLKLLNKTYGKVDQQKKIYSDLSDLYKDFSSGAYHVFGPKTKNLIKHIGKVDAVINCAGIIKPYVMKNPLQTFFINGGLPWILSSIYKEKLIQITTDCVFNGIEGAPYSEKSLKTPNDLYGLSKSLGEPDENSLVLRTSIIGPEIGSSVSLLEWFRSQENREVRGFVNQFWNGITTKQFAKICKLIISKRNQFPQHGLFHIFSTRVSKYELLREFRGKYKSNVLIKPFKADRIDRTLSSIYDFCSNLHLPSLDQMLNDL